MNSPIHYFDNKNPPGLAQSKRSGILSIKTIHDFLFQRVSTNNPKHTRVATGILLLWHDHWEEAHTIAQSDEGDPDHDFLHGMIHRREEDFANSKYWFRSAGNHPCLPLIAARVKTISSHNSLVDKLTAEGVWNPLRFVDLVKNHTQDEAEIFRTIQAAEMMGFYEWLTGELS
jgi:hypothetical protein